MPGKHVRFHLSDGIDSHPHYDEQGRSSEVERHIHLVDQDLGQDTDS